MDKAVIGFIQDYGEDELGGPRLYTFQDKGVKISKPDGVSTGSSIKFFFV